MSRSAPHESFDTRIADFVATRHGVFTYADAIRLGAPSDAVTRRIRSRRWIRMYHRVYCLAGVPITWQAQLLAACRVKGEIVAACRAAGALHGLSGLPPGIIELVGPRGTRIRRPGVIVHQTFNLIKADITVVDAIPVTSVARTLIDLAGLAVRGQIMPETVAIAFDDALRRRKASIKWIEARAEALRSAGRPGIAFVEELLATRRGVKVPDTLFESRALHMLQNAGFPRPVCQYEIFDGDIFISRVDFAYPHIKLAIEADSFDFHSMPADLMHDRAQSNALQSIGWDLLHLMWWDLDRPEQFLRSLGRYLRAG